LAAAKDNADEIVRAGCVIAILKGGSDLVVGLGDDLGGGNLLGIVAQGAKGMNVSHGDV
jgi:hypothetical protein